MNICILQTAPNNCEKLAETGNTDLADRYFERYLRQHQKEYDAYVIPQVPLTRLMPRISAEPFNIHYVHRLAAESLKNSALKSFIIFVSF